MTNQPTDRVLDRHDFINPAYRENHWRSDAVTKHYASGLAYRAHGLVSTALLAHENDGSSIPQDCRGISDTLSTARAVIGDLISEIEYLERELEDASRNLDRP